MNELTNEKTMTVKQISTLLNVSNETIKRIIRKLYPDKMQSRKITRLTKEESEKVIGEIRVETKNHLTQNESVNNYVTKNDLKEFGKTIVEEMLKQFLPLIQNNNQNKLLDVVKTKVTVKEFANKNNIQSYNIRSLLIIAGRECTRLSKDMNRSIEYRTGKNMGFPEAYYDEDLLETAFLVAKKMQEQNNTLFNN
jgi:Mn-dependent DtxR family transcriptional regulator